MDKKTMLLNLQNAVALVNQVASELGARQPDAPEKARDGALAKYIDSHIKKMEPGQVQLVGVKNGWTQTQIQANLAARAGLDWGKGKAFFKTQRINDNFVRIERYK